MMITQQTSTPLKKKLAFEEPSVYAEAFQTYTKDESSLVQILLELINKSPCYVFPLGQREAS